jgi:beta-hydroxylase
VTATETGPNLDQKFGTDGFKPMARPSAIVRAFMAIVAAVERLNLKCSAVGNPAIYDNATFPWACEIEREWHVIRAELDRVLTR